MRSKALNNYKLNNKNIPFSCVACAEFEETRLSVKRNNQEHKCYAFNRFQDENIINYAIRYLKVKYAGRRLSYFVASYL